MIALERSLYSSGMSSDTPTPQRIIRAMAELLRTHGYGSTGVKQLAEAAEAPVGSLYHHFPGGKRDIAAAALRETGAVYIQLIPLLLDPHDDLVTGVEAAFEAAASDIENTGWANMCPVGTVTGEIADLEPELRKVAAEVITGWIDDGTAYLTRRGLNSTDARQLIMALLAALEGGFILSRGLRSGEPLRAAGRGAAAHAAALSLKVS